MLYLGYYGINVILIGSWILDCYIYYWLITSYMLSKLLYSKIVFIMLFVINTRSNVVFIHCYGITNLE